MADVHTDVTLTSEQQKDVERHRSFNVKSARLLADYHLSEVADHGRDGVEGPLLGYQTREPAEGDGPSASEFTFISSPDREAATAERTAAERATAEREAAERAEREAAERVAAERAAVEGGGAEREAAERELGGWREQPHRVARREAAAKEATTIPEQDDDGSNEGRSSRTPALSTRQLEPQTTGEGGARSKVQGRSLGSPQQLNFESRATAAELAPRPRSLADPSSEGKDESEEKQLRADEVRAPPLTAPCKPQAPPLRAHPKPQCAPHRQPPSHSPPKPQRNHSECFQ